MHVYRDSRLYQKPVTARRAFAVGQEKA